MLMRQFVLGLCLMVAGASSAWAQVTPITPWSWKLTIYDAANYELERKEFTSRSAAEQYLWASSPVNATLRDIKLIKSNGTGAEYKYSGTRSATNPGPLQYQSSVIENGQSVWKWFASEGEAVNAYKQSIIEKWGTKRKACTPVFEDEGWTTDTNPYDGQRRLAKVYVFEENDPKCRPYWNFPYFHGELVSRQRITNHDYVNDLDGNFFQDPQPFTGLLDPQDILHTGPAHDPYGDYTQDQWTVFSRRTAKLIGQPNHCSPMKGNPCDIARGSKHEAVTDASGYGPLDLTRQYDSTDMSGSFGRGWHGPFDYTLMASSDGNQDLILVTPSGKQVDLTRRAGEIDGSQRFRSSDNRSAAASRYYTPDYVLVVRVELPDMSIIFRAPNGGESKKPATITFNGNQEVQLKYDTLGRLERADYLGRSVKYVYEYADTERLHKVSAALMPDGRLITYEYTPDGNLSRVADDSGELFKYGYKTGTSLITSILESGERPREYQYDDLRRLIESTNGPAKYTYGYHPTQTTVTYPSGRVEVTDFESTILRRPVREETVGGLVTTTTFTGGDDIVTEADNAGLTTIRKYSSNSETVQTLLNNALLRTIVTTFEPGTSRPVRIEFNDGVSNLVAQTDYAYNTRRQLTSLVRKDAKTGEQRTTNLSYCEDADLSAPASTCAALGAVKSVDGPRSDVTDTTTYDYYVGDAPGCALPGGYCPYRKGDLWKVNHPTGQTQEFVAYDGGGRLLASKDPNGVTTSLEYDARGRLAAQKVRGADDSVETDDRITRFEYTPSGSVKKLTLPDGTYTRFTYDSALRLTDITDNLGNVVHYTLDNAGNRKQEDIKAGGATVKRTLSRAFNALGQLAALKDSSQNATSFRYDLGGNPDRTIDALGRKTDQTFDGLNRLRTTLQDMGGQAIETRLEYDPFDRLAGVIDPKGLSTIYVYNAFGEQTKLTSADTGVTDYTYNAIGLLATKKDANDAAAHSYTYDALGRPKTVSYGTGNADVDYAYDTVNPACTSGETFAAGRVTAMRTEGTELLYCYDRFGQIVRKVQTVDSKSFTLRYAYTAVGRLRTVTYPDGAVAQYTRDGRGRIAGISVSLAAGPSANLLQNATYEPFGPVKGWNYGNGRSLTRTYDLDYRPKTVFDPASGGLSLSYGYNPASELTELKDGLQSSSLAKYEYDTLGRLKTTRDGPTGIALETYGYDAVGNRTSLIHGGATDVYSYPSDSHRLSGIGATGRSYDSVGNTVAIGGTAKEFIYNANDRLKQVKQSGVTKATYRYNAKGERVASINGDASAGTVYTLYDEAGHWIGDYDSAGAALQQAVWMGDVPVGLLAGAGSAQSLKYVQPDHLGTPRAVIDPARNVAIWAWDAKSEAFGNSPPNQDPDLDGSQFVLNLRFPGQRHDSASGLVYNYFRDYDPATGRYIQSDPIGLQGGINTYLYANAKPGSLADMYGLASGMECAKCAGSPDSPIQDSWSMLNVNSDWSAKISVSTEDGTVVIRGDLTVSGVGAELAANDINKYWNGATGNFEGTNYRSDLTMTPVPSDGDLRIVRYGLKAWKERNDQLCSGQTIATAKLGGSTIKVSPLPTWKEDSMIAHEFGHTLGLDHAKNTTGSIMSYDQFPKVLPQDLFNVANGYKK